jgi:hypothetical protein
VAVIKLFNNLCSVTNASFACLRCQIISAITHNTKTPTSRLIKAQPGSIPGGEKKNPNNRRIERTAAST